MERNDLLDLACILAALVRVEGMRGENEVRAMRDQAPAYSDDDIYEAAGKAQDAIEHMGAA
jgi:hypothetical protein